MKETAMKFASLVEVKNKTSQIFRTIHTGKPMVFTHRGKPWIVAIPVPEHADAEEILFWHSDWFRQRLHEAEQSPRITAKELTDVISSKDSRTHRKNHR